jgi:hypothetical protein
MGFDLRSSSLFPPTKSSPLSSCSTPFSSNAIFTLMQNGLAQQSKRTTSAFDIFTTVISLSKPWTSSSSFCDYRNEREAYIYNREGSHRRRGLRIQCVQLQWGLLGLPQSKQLYFLVITRPFVLKCT